MFNRSYRLLATCNYTSCASDAQWQIPPNDLHQAIEMCVVLDKGHHQMNKGTTTGPVLVLSGGFQAVRVSTKWVGEKRRPLLSIKGSIDWKHECVSAASHPWTADNGPGRGWGWGVVDTAESNQQPSGVKMLSWPQEWDWAWELQNNPLQPAWLLERSGPNGSNLPRSSNAIQPPINYLDSVGYYMVELDSCAVYPRCPVILGIGRKG